MALIYVAGVIGLAVAVYVWFAFDRRRYKGVSMFQRHAIEKRGHIGQAKVLDVAEVSSYVTGANGRIVYHLGDLVLEVQRDGHPPYRAPCRQQFIGSQWQDMQVDQTVPVRIDPANPQRVYVDIAARVAAGDARERADREQHAQRQAELLRDK